MRFELRGALRALREEKSELDTERERLEAGRRRLGEKRETAREERRALAEAAEAMARAEKKYEARIKEMRDFGEVSGGREEYVCGGGGMGKFP